MKTYYLRLFDTNSEPLNEDPIKFKAMTPNRAIEAASRIARSEGAKSWAAADNNGRELKAT